MTGWFSKDLGDAMLAGDGLRAVEDRVTRARAAGAGATVAAFVRHETHGGLHCHVRVYFPPACADIAAALGAIPCAKPSRRGLGMLAGSEAAWPALFGADAPARPAGSEERP